MVDLIAEFARYLGDRRRLSQRTIRCYTTDLVQFCDFLVSRKAPVGEPAAGVADWYNQSVVTCLSVAKKASVDSSLLLTAATADVSSFLEHCRDHYSVNAVIRKAASLRAFYKYAVKAGHLSDNPAGSVKTAKPQLRRPMTLTPEQVAHLFSVIRCSDWIKARDRAVFELIYSTGIRVSELVKLKLENIDFMKEILNIPLSAGKARSISINSSSLQALQLYIKMKAEQFSASDISNGLLFINKYGLEINERSIRRKLAGYVRLAQMPPWITVNTLRHSFAQKILDAGAGADKLVQLLGHRCEASVSCYTG